MKKTFKEISKQDLLIAFKKIDDDLVEKDLSPLSILIIGAASILMLDIRDRGTNDIDLAYAMDCRAFAGIAKKLDMMLKLSRSLQRWIFPKGKKLRYLRAKS